MTDIPLPTQDAMGAYSDDELLPLSGIQHVAFCERQWALINIEQLWRENLDTTLGEIFHERAHLAGYSIKDGVIARRSMPVLSRRLGLIGYADIVEFVPSEVSDAVAVASGRYEVSPVEYKKGGPKTSTCDRLQVAAQALCLEEMLGTKVSVGHLFYGETRRRETVDITASLREMVIATARRMHELARRGDIPVPVRRPCCSHCSLTNECMPEVSGRDAIAYWRDAGVDWGDENETPAKHALRFDATVVREARQRQRSRDS
jgi:CRISPR-associated exonuclease Cas4